MSRLVSGPKQEACWKTANPSLNETRYYGRRNPMVNEQVEVAGMSKDGYILPSYASIIFVNDEQYVV